MHPTSLRCFNSPMDLPPGLTKLGLTARPLTESDAEAVFAAMAKQEVHDIGSVQIELADIVADWRRPSFDIEGSTIGIFEGLDLIGYGEISGAGRGDAAVVPSARGRGIGTFLAQWMQNAARQAGYASIRMPVPQGSAGDLLLKDLGYCPAWTAWELELPPGAVIAGRELPAGYQLRQATAEDDRAIWIVLEDGFLEWADRNREPFEDFVALTRERPGFEPWNLRVVTDPARDVVAATVVLLAGDEQIEGCVYRLAVRREERGRGLAQALLADCFSQARQHGASRSSLSTDSRTGALSLYEKVGMRVTSVWVSRAIDL